MAGKAKEGSSSTSSPEEIRAEIPKCGVVMPISSMDGYAADHWGEVYRIIKEAAAGAGYEPRLVSESPEAGVIQKRIVQNLYDDPMVICDVSGKNPNVMFELGLRLAFDKPTIIVQDDLTKAPFDTSVIEYLEYPSTLHYYSVINFKDELREKILATAKRAAEDPDYSTFLKHFGEFKPSKLTLTELPEADFILRELREIRGELRSERARKTVFPKERGPLPGVQTTRINMSGLSNDERQEFATALALQKWAFNYSLPAENIQILGVPPTITREAIEIAAAQANLSRRIVFDLEGAEFSPF